MERARKGKGQRKFSMEKDKLVASKRRNTKKRQVGKIFIQCEYKELRYQVLSGEMQSLRIHLYSFSHDY